MRILRRALLSLLWTVFLASPVRAVLITAGDGSGNTSAPSPDPGWANVGTPVGGGISVVYLGNGWVLTANHVGAHDVTLAGKNYRLVTGSAARLTNPDSTLADLLMFRVDPLPALPSLTVASAAPAGNAAVTMIGTGRDRGAATTWSGKSGWYWASTFRMRWGTNRVVNMIPTTFDVVIGTDKTRAFETDFTTTGGTTYEAQAAVGDSGGAVFTGSGSSTRLAGIMIAIGPYDGQPAETALSGNATYAADLSYYKSQIDALVALPVCSDNLDNDSDGYVDYPDDPGCSSATDDSERGGSLVCDDGIDNDGDGLADYPFDPGCKSINSPRENPQCNDGIDNDGDGKIDLADPECTQPWINSEAATSSCGLLGPELALVMPAAVWLRRRVRRRA